MYPSTSLTLVIKHKKHNCTGTEKVIKPIKLLLFAFMKAATQTSLMDGRQPSGSIKFKSALKTTPEKFMTLNFSKNGTTSSCHNS
jgi:hypothetical protein